MSWPTTSCWADAAALDLVTLLDLPPDGAVLPPSRENLDLYFDIRERFFSRFNRLMAGQEWVGPWHFDPECIPELARRHHEKQFLTDVYLETHFYMTSQRCCAEEPVLFGYLGTTTVTPSPPVSKAERICIMQAFYRRSTF